MYVVPEASTLMFTGGATFKDLTTAQVKNFQNQLLHVQMELEDSFSSIAAMSNKASFVLCDRGTCDGRAYMPNAMWQEILNDNGLDIIRIRDARYDLVIHLVTAADGALDFYTLENNKARSETPGEAVAVDKRTQRAWVGHPHLKIVDNRTDFREKINRVDARISELVGLRLSKKVVRKFLLRDCEGEIVTGGENFVVEQTFLARRFTQDIQECVRRRGKNGVFTFVHKVRGEVSETKRQITNREYLSLLAHCDPDRRTLRISRQCFLYKDTYFVLDSVMNVDPIVRMLRCHCDEKDNRMEVPKWFSVEKEVTGMKEFSMHSLSLRVCPIRVRTLHVPERQILLNGDDESFAKSY